MKPSIKISEMNPSLPFKGVDLGNGITQMTGIESAINTIIEYLDEEYEKKHAVRCFSSISLDSYPPQYVCDVCGTHWHGGEKTPICKGKPRE